jgi:hypothetical protein
MGDQNLPSPGLFIDDNLVTLYGETIDQIISDLGRDVTFYLPPSESGCPNCEPGFDGSSQGVTQSPNPFPLGSPFNKSFPTGGFCPVCNGTHKILVPVVRTYQSSIQRNPKDFDYEQYGIDFQTANVMKLKNRLTIFEDVKNAEKVLIDGDIYVPIRHPIKTGLRDLRYVQSWWTMVKK